MNFTNSTSTIAAAPFIPYIWPYGVGVIVVNLFGIFGNSLILILFVKRRLGSGSQTFGHVIGHLAVNHLVFNISSIGRGFLVQFKDVQMPNIRCFFWMTPALLTYTTGNTLILSMGIDRFLSFSYPHKKFSGAYAYAMVSAAWILGALNLVVAYLYTDNSPVPSCSIGTALNGLAKSIWNRTNWVIFGLVTAVYPLTYIQVWRHSRLNSVHADTVDELRRQNVIKRNLRLLNTFILIVAVYVGSGLFTQLVVFLVNTLSTDRATIFYTESYTGILANFTSVCDFYVYYARSSEYRKEFNKVLVKIWPCCFSVDTLNATTLNTTGSQRSKGNENR